MINFGTSAYMKILGLNARPRDTEIRKRVKRGKGGYDFHKAMRKIAVGHASGESTVEETQRALAAITKLPERNSAAQATNQLVTWLSGQSITPVEGLEKRAESESGLFSVRFTPDFELGGPGRAILVHMWNTKYPKLTAREAMGTLGLFDEAYDDFDLAIVCLRQKHLFHMTDGTRAAELARLLARNVEARIARLSEDSEADRDIDGGRTAAF